MIKKILFCLILFASALSLRADGDWNLHPAFDNYFQQLFDTPDRVYIVAYGQIYDQSQSTYSEPKGELFVLDKSSGETLAYTSRNYLSGTIISKAQYNPHAGYLCIVYLDGNIDLLYDKDDRVVNIPELKNASMMDSRKVNAISFSLNDNLIYMATDFGFIVLNPEKRSIDKARNYHTSFNAIARVGSKLILADKSRKMVQEYSKPLQSINDFNIIPADQGVCTMVPLSNNRILAAQDTSVNVLKVNSDNTLSDERMVINNITLPYCTAGKQGYVLSGSWRMISADFNGTFFDCSIPIYATWLWNTYPITSSDFKTYWAADGRDGIKSYDRDGLNDFDTKFSNEKTYSRPNSSSVYLGCYMTYSDKYGLLVQNNSCNRIMTSMLKLPTLISGLQNGEWTNYGNIYRNSQYADTHQLAKGIVQDPNNPDLFYSGSYGQGMQIIDLANPDNIINLGVRGGATSTLPGFVAIKEPAPEDSTSNTDIFYLSLSEPAFDNQGNMWVANHPLEGTDPFETVLVWPAPSIRNKDYTTFHQVKTGFSGDHDNKILPLSHSSNRNLVLVCSNITHDSPILLLDHKGTIDNDNDDRELIISTLYDQDASGITRKYYNCMFEDPNTGTVWFGTDNGVFTIQPWRMFDNPTQARRIKVARNDGTNMADYLLDGVDVQHITADGNGNKWFCTAGAGVVQTSSDGTHVMRQFTTDNSYLPSNQTFMARYNPASNSMMIGTMNGLAEYFMPAASSDNAFDRVKIYPNPVRPDFVGNITIEGLLDNTLVKIVDSEGNLVKELGSSMGGSVSWNGTTLTGSHANSGVYFVLMSRQGEGANEANVGKIVIVK